MTIPEEQYLAWAIALSTLLDQIEMSDDLEEIKSLCAGRFEIAENHGMTVEYSGVLAPRLVQ